MEQILKKLADIQKAIGPMQKDTRGYNYQYFDINQLLEKLQPLLEKAGMVLLQPIESGNVISRIYNLEDGKFVESVIKLPENVKPQDMGSAITYYRRYSLTSLLALTAEDDDGAKTNPKKIEDKKPITKTNDVPW